MYQNGLGLIVEDNPEILSRILHYCITPAVSGIALVVPDTPLSTRVSVSRNWIVSPWGRTYKHSRDEPDRLVCSSLYVNNECFPRRNTAVSCTRTSCVALILHVMYVAARMPVNAMAVLDTQL